MNFAWSEGISWSFHMRNSMRLERWNLARESESTTTSRDSQDLCSIFDLYYIDMTSGHLR
jgi:hypothetical protein